jgi:Histidine kinase-, DNA gyrase B-, and HSP90-like ATPase
MPKKKRSRFHLTTTLDVLDELGIKMYTNSAAVLSEIIANAWDADARVVDVAVMGKGAARTLSIEDDGVGMSEVDINARFLTVGYQRRDVKGGGVTPSGRKVMGRKGIGKLSSFSIADVIEVHTVKGRSRLAFRLDIAKLRARAKAKATYEPDEIPCARDLKKGTRIVLSRLKPKVHMADRYLRRRLSRRFSVINTDDGFEIRVNAKPLTLEDREYYDKFQYVWHYGDDDLSTVATKATHREARSGNVATIRIAGRSVRCRVQGWIATVETRSQLASADDDNLNRVSLVVRGKVAHENLLEETTEAGLFATYIIGEIRADFLDLDNATDIAASNRQGILENDARFEALIAFFKKELTYIGSAWTDLRNREGTEKALAIPAVFAWYNLLSKDEQRVATSMLGKLNSLDVKADSERRTLFSQGILAFEMFRFKRNLSALEKIDAADIPKLSQVFTDMSSLEAAMYHEIVRQRLEMIRRLETLVDTDELERFLQQHVAEQLWLLDPSWARATEQPIMEKSIKRALNAPTGALMKKIAASRLDIKYREASGRHIVIELKKASRVVSTTEILEQVTKYEEGVRESLRAAARSNEPYEIIVLVGPGFSDWTDDVSREQSRRILAAKHTRVMRYAEVIANALASYQQYLQRESSATAIAAVIDSVNEADLTGYGAGIVVPGKTPRRQRIADQARTGKGGKSGMRKVVKQPTRRKSA